MCLLGDYGGRPDAGDNIPSHFGVKKYVKEAMEFSFRFCPFLLTPFVLFETRGAPEGRGDDERSRCNHYQGTKRRAE